MLQSYSEMLWIYNKYALITATCNRVDGSQKYNIG